MNINLLVLYLSSLLSLINTNHTFVDQRDGKEYEVVQVGKNWWFNENLLFESELCYCTEKNRRKSKCQKANYYSNKELQTVCPDGWHVATRADWELYIDWILSQRKLSLDMLLVDTIPTPNNTMMMKDTTGLLQLFSEANLLRMSPDGWVQGKRHKNMESTTFWAVDAQNGDNRFHFHISDDAVNKHAHDHNINDRPSKTRRFAVRCVCENDSLINNTK